MTLDPIKGGCRTVETPLFHQPSVNCYDFPEPCSTVFLTSDPVRPAAQPPASEHVRSARSSREDTQNWPARDAPPCLPG